MCFNGQMSAGFAALGLALSWWIHSRTCNTGLAICVFFFFTMELLQAIQYLYIASDIGTPVCDTMVNKILTVLGFLHICMQPYFCHGINEALSQSPSPKYSAEHNLKLHKYRAQYKTIKRLCIIGGLHLFLRLPMAYVPGWNSLTMESKSWLSTEWVRGPQLCTFKSEAMYHLGWSIPLADPTYNIPGIGLHAFLMFAPFLALYEKRGMVMQGMFLYFTGPGLASLITSDLKEQASIWCFFSIAQIAMMLFLIRETLIVNWGRAGTSMMELCDEDKIAAKQKLKK